MNAVTQLSLDVVIVPLVGGEALARCLAALRQCENNALRRTIVVTSTPGEEARSRWTPEYDHVEFVGATHDNVPSRRLQGVAAADADVVALLEDTSWPQPGWAGAALAAFTDRDVVAAGGSVRVSPALPARYRALGYMEYAAFGPEAKLSLSATGSVDRVPGNNMAFRRERLLEILSEARFGLFEHDVVARLCASNGKVVARAGMAVCYGAIDRHGARLSTRFGHGRIYAAERLSTASVVGRLSYLAKTVLLPPILTWRAMRGAAHATPRRWLAPEVGWIALMATAWSVGEAAGAVLGGAGSIETWR
ncbi:MAG: glycosyltransferase [Alphaproteobacteria bacterium]